jgi:hypothetical protein
MPNNVIPNNLLTPIVNDRTRSVNFFNGRLLTGEDLTAEQQANRVAHSLLGHAVGSGVAYGLEVSVSATLNKVASPVLSIKRGLAINSNGGTLLLDSDTDISLVRPTGPANSAPSVFAECLPMQSGVYIAGAGVYLLTIGPASATQGLAEVSGVSTGAAPCNSKYKADGVQFRLVQLDLTLAELGDVNHLRNLVAYKCFGVDDWATAVADPFGTTPGGHGLIDQLRSAKTITGCEVPLAVLYWTATDGIVFIDMWAARRPLVANDLLDTWTPEAGRRRIAEGLAMFLQFETHINDLIDANFSQSVLGTINANQFFRFLPPAGMLPLAGSVSLGFDSGQFFFSKTSRGPLFIEGAKVGPLMHSSFSYPPIDLTNPEMVWLYWVRENLEPGVQPSPTSQPYLIFTNGHVPFQALAQFDLNYWSYANFI